MLGIRAWDEGVGTADACNAEDGENDQRHLPSGREAHWHIAGG